MYLSTSDTTGSLALVREIALTISLQVRDFLSLDPIEASEHYLIQCVSLREGTGPQILARKLPEVELRWKPFCAVNW